MEAAGSPGASWELATVTTAEVAGCSLDLMIEPPAPASQGPGAQVKPLHFTAHKAGQGGGTRAGAPGPLPSCLPSAHLTREDRKEQPDNETNAGPCGEAKPDLMESLSLPPLQTAEEGGVLGYASQRLPAVLIGAGLRQSISPCPSLWEKQWEIKNTQLAGRGGGC